MVARTLASGHALRGAAALGLTCQLAGAHGTRAIRAGGRLYPWPTTMLLHAVPFSEGQQRTAAAATAGQTDASHGAWPLRLAFHVNFNQCVCACWSVRSQAAASWPRCCAPGSVTAFYAGMSILQGKDDIFLDLKEKFRNTCKSGLMYQSFIQLSNFSLVPFHWRTPYTGICGFLWVTFSCFSQQNGDDALKLAFTLHHRKVKGSKRNVKDSSHKVTFLKMRWSA
nr:mpv17-like protein [Dasypus novemcinctus]